MSWSDAMDFPRHKSSAVLPHRQPARGSFLLQVMLGLSVIALAGLLLFSILHRMRQEAKVREWEKQLLEFSSVFNEYKARRGDWPDSVVTAGPRLIELGWNRGSPFGGEYTWKPSGVPGQPGSIVLTAFHPRFPLMLEASDLLAVDRHVDDGDLSSGRFRTGFNGWPSFQVAANP